MNLLKCEIKYFHYTESFELGIYDFIQDKIEQRKITKNYKSILTWSACQKLLPSVDLVFYRHLSNTIFKTILKFSTHYSDIHHFKTIISKVTNKTQY